MKDYQKKKLSELSEKKDAVVSGPFGSNLKVSDYKTEGIPILRLQNIGKGYFIEKNIKYISEEKAEELKYHSFIVGDIALAKLGIPIGKTCIIPEHFKSGIITADIVRIRPDTKNVDYKYLEFYLNTDLSVAQLTGNISGATRPRVNLSSVRDIEIPIPPLPEQKRIVAILDKAFATIAKAKANAEQNLNNAKELFESYLQGVFENKGSDWVDKKLEELSDKKKSIVSGPFGSNLKVADYRESGVPMIRLQNIGKGVFIEKNIKYLDTEKAEELKSHSFRTGDIVLAKLGIPIGKTCIIPEHFGSGIIVADIVRIRPNKNNISYKFLEYFLNTKLSVSQLSKNISGATRPRVNLSDVRNIIVPVPPLPEQRKIVLELDALQEETKKLEVIYQQKIDNLEDLKKAALQKAFNGELPEKEIAL